MSCEPVSTCMHETISSWDKGSPQVVKASTSSSLLNLHGMATVISPECRRCICYQADVAAATGPVTGSMLNICTEIAQCYSN